MRLFLKKFAILVVPLLVLLYPIDAGISSLLRNKNDIFCSEYEVWNEIFSSTLKPEIAIYGSSRAFRHFNARVLKDELGMDVYNFGMNGHEFWMEYYRHMKQLEYNGKPKVIIQSLDSFTLQRPKTLYNYTQFLPYMLFKKDLYDYTSWYIGFNREDFYVPMLRYFGETKALNATLSMILNAGDNRKTRDLGYSPSEDTWNNDLEIARKSKESFEIPLDEGTIRLFRRYIAECRENGIKLIFVYSPEQIEGQKYMSNRPMIMDMYRDMADEYDIPFFDYSDNEISMDKKYFYNSLHLNKDGAEKFTRLLAKDLAESGVLNEFR